MSELSETFDWDDDIYCPRCDDSGEINVCLDSVCQGLGECIHGDGMILCPVCGGVNAI